jgi:hypothetical protein
MTDIAAGRFAHGVGVIGVGGAWLGALLSQRSVKTQIDATSADVGRQKRLAGWD